MGTIKHNIIAGTKFNQLTVIKYTKTNDHGDRWALFQCECGGTREARYSHVRSGEIKRCKSKKHLKGTNKQRARYRDYLKNAALRGLVYELTEDESYVFFNSPCYYCGWDKDTINGIDRKDNTKGYMKSNCVPCCTICNRAKSTLTEKEYKAWIKNIKDCGKTF